MKARFLKAAKISELFQRVPEHLNVYRFGEFDFLRTDPAFFFEVEHEISDEELQAVACAEDDQNEIACCIRMFNALGSFSPYLARDPRLWVSLTHSELLPYSRTRWPIPEDNQKAVAHIRKHFFAVGSRGIERDNAASRLWWMAYICSRVKGLTLEEALGSFLYQSDVRANIIERPTTSQSVEVFTALLKKLHDSYHSDKALFARERFRALMKKLNLKGGVTLLSGLGEHEIARIVDECCA